MLVPPKHKPVAHRHVGCFHSLVLTNPPCLFPSSLILKPLQSWAGKSSESQHMLPWWLDFIQRRAREETLTETMTSVLSCVPSEARDVPGPVLGVFGV